MISFDFHLPITLFFVYGRAFCGGNGSRSLLAGKNTRVEMLHFNVFDNTDHGHRVGDGRITLPVGRSACQGVTTGESAVKKQRASFWIWYPSGPATNTKVWQNGNV